MIKPDLDAALDCLAQDDPEIRERYQRGDPQARAMVAECSRLAREMANEARDIARHRILQSPGARARYATDASYAHEVEARAILAAIATTKREMSEH